jgi:hypothetical protein
MFFFLLFFFIHYHIYTAAPGGAKEHCESNQRELAEPRGQHKSSPPIQQHLRDHKTYSSSAFRDKEILNIHGLREQ